MGWEGINQARPENWNPIQGSDLKFGRKQKTSAPGSAEVFSGRAISNGS